MASFHRKLFPDDSNTSYSPTTSVQTCLYFCDSEKNNETTGYYCPTACLAICPSICHYSLSDLISPPDPLPQPNKPQQSSSHTNLSPLLISMLIILASAFLLITFYALYTKLYNRQTRPRLSRDQDHSTSVVPSVIFHPPWYITTVGLSPSLINTITVIKYTKEENSCAVECTDCAVCLAEFEEGEDLRILPKCNHAFHIPCIDTWLGSHTNCPLCRAPVLAPDHHLHRTVENTAAAEEAGEVRIDLTEIEGNMGNSGSVNCVVDKELRGINNGNNVMNKGSGSSSSSSSQRWGLETQRGAANFVTRSFSCGAKIFSSRYNSNNNNNDENCDNNSNNDSDGNS